MRIGRPRSAGVLLLLLGIGVGLSVGALLVPTRMPAALIAENGPDSFELVPVEYSDPTEATLILDGFGTFAASSRVAGTVTRLKCVAGQELASGTSPLSVDGEPILALHLETPPWRSITFGTSGDDVRALQKELGRLGYEVDPSGTWREDTRRAVLEMLDSVGIKDNQGVLDPSMLVYLPSASETISKCNVRAGDTVEPGLTLLEFSPKPSLLELQWDEAGTASGDRDFVAGEVVVPLTSDLTVPQEQILTVVRLAQQSGVASGGDSNDSNVAKIEGKLVLRKPISAFQVPPPAVVVDASHACVFDEDLAAHQVAIQGSGLGSTVILFDADPPSVIKADPPAGASCK